MKVIKKGRKQKGWAKELECTGAGNEGGGCRATLLVEQGDLFQTNSFSMGEENGPFATFTCIACGVDTDVSSFPNHLIRELPMKTRFSRSRQGVRD